MITLIIIFSIIAIFGGYLLVKNEIPEIARKTMRFLIYTIIGIVILFILINGFSSHPWITILILLGIIFCIGLLCCMLPNIIMAGLYVIAAALDHKGKVESEAWEYWEKMKQSRWEDLSKDEQKKLIHACMIIANDVGTVTTEEEQKQLLIEQLPIFEPNIGLSYKVED